MASSLSSDVAEFGLKLLKQTGGTRKDVLLSPMSISVALGMTLAGANGETAEQLKSAMFPTTGDAVHSAFKQVIPAVFKRSESVEIRTANRLYLEKSRWFYEDFVGFCKNNYGSDVTTFDGNRPEEVRLHINRWVSRETNNKIKDLLPPNAITEEIRMLLINVVYFKGEWINQFDPSDTQPTAFHTAPGHHQMVDMMSLPEPTRLAYRKCEDLDCEVLGLPYQGGRLSFFVFLPTERFGLADMMSKLTGAKILQIVKSAARHTVNVKLPKFKMNWSGSLMANLKQLGIIDLFAYGVADFSRMSDTLAAVSDVYHKTFMKIDEKGTEAAAATDVLVADGPMPQRPTVHVDHPFLHAVIDTKTDSILFLGTTFNPAN